MDLMFSQGTGLSQKAVEDDVFTTGRVFVRGPVLVVNGNTPNFQSKKTTYTTVYRGAFQNVSLKRVAFLGQP